MKKKKELDVDFIGGQGPLTKEEEEAISRYIKAKKLELAKKELHKKRKTYRKKMAA